MPDGLDGVEALARTTHLGVGAHPDDLEIMAFPAIAACHSAVDRWFAGVTCGNGARSPRLGPYAGMGNDEMVATRRREQDQAARIGGYGAMIQLGFSTPEMTGRGFPRLVADLQAVLDAAGPGVVFTHNPADRHPSHVAVFAAVLAAIRRLPRGRRPEALYGGEVWRDLDWLPDPLKVTFDVTGHDRLAAELMAAFRSQIAGGKRYDLAVDGRRRAHATYSDPASPDRGERVCLAMDLTPLVRHPRLDPVRFVRERVNLFRRDVEDRLRAFVG